MCHDCGCQRSRVIAVLCRGHEWMLALAADLAHAARTGDVDEALRTAELLRAALDEHIAIEERELFPVLLADDETEGHAEHIEALRREHRSLLDHLEGMPAGGAAWAARLLEEVSDIGTHVLKEEYGFFPEAFATLPPEQRGFADAAPSSDDRETTPVA